MTTHETADVTYPGTSAAPQSYPREGSADQGTGSTASALLARIEAVERAVGRVLALLPDGAR